MSDSSPALKDRELAGYVGPIVRGTSETVLRRRVKTYDRESGEVTGEVTMRQVIGGLAEVTALEIEVIDGKRPKKFTCDGCGKVFPVPKKGNIRTTCELCRSAGQTECPCGCGNLPPRAAFRKSVVVRRGGPWVCPREGNRKKAAAARERYAAMTPEQRSEVARRSTTQEQRSAGARKAYESRTPEQRRTAALKRVAARTPEQRREAARKAYDAKTAKQKAAALRNLRVTPERRAEIGRKAMAAKTAEQRNASFQKVREALRKGQAARTPEQRREAARKAWATRRANAAKSEAAE